MKETKQQWYVEATKNIYTEFRKAGIEIRLTDSQIARAIAKEHGGSLSKHIANIRRSQCNNKNQPYIHGTD